MWRIVCDFCHYTDLQLSIRSIDVTTVSNFIKQWKELIPWPL